MKPESYSKLFCFIFLLVINMGFSICSGIDEGNPDRDPASDGRIEKLLKENMNRYEDFTLKRDWTISEVVNLLKNAKAKKAIGTARLKAISLKEIDKGLLTISVEEGEGENATGNLLCFTWSDKKWRLFEVTSYKNF